jgi:hypothetical protein
MREEGDGESFVVALIFIAQFAHWAVVRSDDDCEW